MNNKWHRLLSVWPAN